MSVFHQMTHVQALSRDAGVPFPYDCFIGAKPLPMEYYAMQAQNQGKPTGRSCS